MSVLIVVGFQASNNAFSDVTVTTKFQESTYDAPNYQSRIASQQKRLSELEKQKVFDIIHNHYLSKIPPEHKDFFKNYRSYKILSFASADLLANKNRDFAFIVYDSLNKGVKILIYDGFRKLFKQLYKEIRIMDALSESNCSFYQFGSNDYKIGEIITYIEDTLIKKGPLYFVNNFDILKCENISKDDAFVLERGCFGLGYDKDNINTFTSLCLATDSVYNNWDCMRYDKKQNLFILFYGQAFAD